MDSQSLFRRRWEEARRARRHFGDPQEGRVELRRRLGGFEDPVPDLKWQVLEAESRTAFRRSLIEFSTRTGARALGHFVEPLDLEPGPAVLCLPGHGAGADALVGLAEEPYQANFALQCVGHGYRAFALEMLSFGRRRSERIGPNGWSCDADAKAALLLGETLLGWRVWDAMRAIDLLRVLPGVNPDAIALMGISGGGTVAIWTAALDERVAATVLSGCFCSFEDSILAIDHCLDNFVPGILPVADLPDLARLVAPRGLFVEGGTEDPIFPVEAVRQAVAMAQVEFAESPGSFAYEIFDGGHEFRGARAFEFLDRHFAGL